MRWSDACRRFEGAPLKLIAFGFVGRQVRGEAIVTRDGLDGGTIYAVCLPIRGAIDADGAATITRGAWPRHPESRRSRTSYKRRANLFPVAVGLLREAAGPSLASISDSQR